MRKRSLAPTFCRARMCLTQGADIPSGAGLQPTGQIPHKTRSFSFTSSTVNIAHEQCSAWGEGGSGDGLSGDKP